MHTNVGVMALLGAVLLSGVTGWWLTRTPSPAAPASEVSGLASNVKAEKPSTVAPARQAQPVHTPAALGVSRQPLDADDPIAYGEDFAPTKPANEGDPMEAHGPIADSKDFTPSAPVNVGELMDADDPLTNGEDSARSAPINVGEPIDADGPVTYEVDSAPSAPVNEGEPMDADQAFLADNQQ